MTGEVREGDAGGGDRLGPYRRVPARRAALRRRARCSGRRGRVPHAVEAAAALPGPLGGGQTVERLLRGHLAGARARAGVDKPGSPPVEEQQIVQQSRAVFD
ncbi:hypothetical protein, partial [Intestinimonas massiliensis (ex Afouda et al. 2020)]|uniref:hypothetical protein n=1 Tax=Intestinimonas massiliensis (ex Afouda et al. 2020) TaxID=1673721 RepID=UPI0034A045FD